VLTVAGPIPVIARDPLNVAPDPAIVTVCPVTKMPGEATVIVATFEVSAVATTEAVLNHRNLFNKSSAVWQQVSTMSDEYKVPIDKFARNSASVT